jgi:hypothetical protein
MVADFSPVVEGKKGSQRYAKRGELAGGGGLGGGNVLDVTLHRFLNGLLEAIHFRGCALRDQLDPTIGQIAYAARDGEIPRDPLGGPAETHALHEPGEVNRSADGV